MRLFDTYSKSLVELPAAARPGADVLLRPDGLRARARRKRAAVRARDVAALVAARAAATRRTLVHNITDVNDKIYEAAPGASAELAERATAWYLEDTGGLGLGMPDALPRVTEHIPAIVAFIEQLLERGHAYAVDGDVYFRVGELPRVRPALGPAAGPGRGAGAEPAQGGSARLRALEGEQAGRGHGVGRAVGPRPAGLAHRVLGDGGGAARRGVRDPRRRPRSRLPPSRERARAVAGARARLRADLGAQRPAAAAPARRCRSRSATSPRIREALDEWGRETLLVFFLGGPLAQADRLLGRRRWPRQARRVETLRNAFRCSRGAEEERWRASSSTRSTTTSTRPRRSRCCTTGRRRGSSSCCAVGSSSSASARSPSRSRRRRRSSELARARAPGAGRPRLRDGRPSPRRDRGGRLGDARRGAAATRSSRGGDGRPRLRPAPGARGAARPPRGARAARDRAGARGRALARRGEGPTCGPTAS